MLNGFHQLKLHHQFIFTVILGVAIVAFWWGIWGFMDDYFLPKHRWLWLKYLAAVVFSLLVLTASHFLVQGLL